MAGERKNSPTNAGMKVLTNVHTKEPHDNVHDIAMKLNFLCENLPWRPPTRVFFDRRSESFKQKGVIS